MLKHIVLMKFKEGAADKDIRDMEEGLAGLPPKIPEILQYEFGRDGRKERSFDFALVSAFRDMDALKRYQTHPDHVVVLGKVRALCEKIVAADFETGRQAP
ncbi:MAG TPA: Dabb family protein [Syntrophales bacterium]|nr:Dabb family protein [Syntrophales bacterium]HQB31630.1 Dabb family protein [Syntrophales bacterium]HQN78978.1 Dabb family protein [Syntrophales bacterium]HQQ28205.1 Dabb family protein [Syntrophales bacterium]